MSAKAELLNLEEIDFSPEVVSLGKEASIAHSPWGERVDNLRLRKIVGDAAWEKNEKTIAATGISVRHHILLPELWERKDEEIAEEQIGIGAAITRRALRANGWDKVDLLIVSSSAPPCEDFAEQIAERAGLANAEIRFYCLACNGAVAGLHDILQFARLKLIPKNIRVAITPVEALSYGVNLKEREIDVLAAAIFGNYAASLAFTPESFKLLAGKSWVVPDEEGVILTPKGRSYKLPPEEERLEPPGWYQVETGAEEKFAFTQKRVVTKLLESDSKYLKMKGLKTAFYFAREVGPRVGPFFKDYYQDKSIRPEVVLGIFHQPSAGVLGLINQKIRRSLDGVDLPALEIPWVLDRVEMGNASSATTFPAWAQLEKEGRIPKGQPFNLTAFGVGASVTSMMIEMNEV
jgi:3-oxoacyl-[acyl-carrier-protein] synthase III